MADKTYGFAIVGAGVIAPTHAKARNYNTKNLKGLKKQTIKVQNLKGKQ